MNEQHQTDYDIYKFGIDNFNYFNEDVPDEFVIKALCCALNFEDHSLENLKNHPKLKKRNFETIMMSSKLFINAYYNAKTMKLKRNGLDSFNLNVAKIKSASQEIVDAMHDISINLIQHKKSRNSIIMRRTQMLLSILEAMNHPWRTIASDEAFSSLTHVHETKSEFGYRIFRHAFSPLARVYDVCDKVLRELKVSDGAESHAANSGRLKDLDREAFVQDLITLYNAIFGKVSARSIKGKNPGPSPFMRFLAAIYMQLHTRAMADDLPTHVFIMPSESTVNACIKAL